MVFPWSILRLAAALLCATLCHAAADSGYTIQVYKAEHGLPQNGVTSIIQTSDGYLWIGTYGGLVRFDGVRFKTFDSANTPQMQNSRITALFEDGSGSIWIGHETGDLTRFDRGRFSSVKIPGPFQREAISGIFEDVKRRVYFTTQPGRLRRVDDGATILTSDPEPLRGVYTLARDSQGALWFARAGIVSRVEGERLVPGDFMSELGNQVVFASAAARQGGLWVIAAGRIRRWNGHAWAEDLGAPPWVGDTSITAMMEMEDGSLACGTIGRGLFILRKGAPPLHFDREHGLPQDWIRAVCEDHEGNLWLAVGTSGLVALRPARAGGLTPPDGWHGRSVLSAMAARDGSFWIGTEGAGLYRFFKGEWTRFGENEGILNAFVWSIAEDDRGRIWVGTWGEGLFVQEKDHFQRAPGLESNTTPMPALYFPHAGGPLWVGSGTGLICYENGRAETFGSGLVAPDVRCVAEDRRGVIWFGMCGGGLGRLEAGQVQQFRKADGLSSDFIQALFIDADETLWIGTADAGIVRYKSGKFAALTAAQGLRNNVICHIADDGQGYFWVSSHGGIMRLSKEELNRCADGAAGTVGCLSYGVTDGVPSLQSSGGLQPAGCRSEDGKLWFTTINGLVSVDPANIRTNPHPPRVAIESFRADDAEVPSAKGALRIPPGRQRFEFEYSALSFSAPERVLFKYRLEGLESRWIGPTAKRAISYSYLPPGDYKFHVTACNNDGFWNHTGAAMAFVVEPFIWQTVWFRAVAIFAAVTLAGAITLIITRQRYRRRVELAEQQRSLERERARIAQDIHDDLGASLTRITLLSQSARGDLDSPATAAEDLDRIYDTARDLTRSLDEIVWAVNPRHDTLDSLATYLGKFAQDFLGAAHIRCRLNMPVELPAWPLRAETRHNVFLAFKEALHNAVKHAAASEVRISLSLTDSAFILSVEDNGRGLQEKGSHPAAGQKNGDTRDGLQNMRQRLAEIGGAFEIQSQPNAGARVTFHVPFGKPQPVH